jgi:hypothetical protein
MLGYTISSGSGTSSISLQRLGGTVGGAVGGAVGGRRDGSGRRSRLRGFWQTNSYVSWMKTGTAVITYRELSIPGGGDFCLEYTWRLEGFAGFPGTDEDSLDPALDEELTLSLEATAQAVEQHGMDTGGTGLNGCCLLMLTISGPGTCKNNCQHQQRAVH